MGRSAHKLPARGLAVPLLALSVTWLTLGCGGGVSKDEVLNFCLRDNVATMDPISADNEFAKQVVAQIYETLYQYHYLLRPYRLVPCLAETLPEVSGDTLTYTIKIKRGVRFQDDPCFPAGKGRELVADDFVYGWKRLADTKLRGKTFWCLEKVKGFEEFRTASIAPSPTDYSKPIEGIQVIDPHTLRIVLKEPYPQLEYVLAMVHTAPMPKEAVDFYKEDIGSHPVGTGPYKLEEWTRGSRVVLVANTHFREELYPNQGTPEDEINGLLADKGKKLPFIKKAIYDVIVEPQPRFLKFKNGELDTVLIEKDSFEQYFDRERGNRVRSELEAQGFRGVHIQSPEVTYQGLNMRDPVLGTSKKLRQAMSLARDFYLRNKTLYSGVAAMATRFLPKGCAEYDPDFRSPYRAERGDFERAAQLLAEAGFPGGEGLPEFVFEATSDPLSRQKTENVMNDWAKIGIKCRPNYTTWDEFLAKVNEGRAQVFAMGWQADYPDAETFLKCFYSKNAVPGPNKSNYSNPAFDDLYEKASRMTDSSERRALYKQLADMVVDDCPVLADMIKVRSSGYREWLKNFKPDDLIDNWLKYWRIEGRELYLSQ
ncbi:MAG: ABC transporter substrate-binding protein [Planctomycetota bacterium]